MQNLLILLLVVVLLALACNTNKKSTTAPDENEVAPDPFDQRLHDIWVLTSMEDKKLDNDKTRPRLEIFPEEGRIAGNGSCNELFGMVAAEGWKISFSNIGTTKMFCRDLMALESNFLSTLKEVDSYKIKGLQLHLMQDGVVKLSFQKVD